MMVSDWFRMIEIGKKKLNLFFNLTELQNHYTESRICRLNTVIYTHYSNFDYFMVVNSPAFPSYHHNYIRMGNLLISLLISWFWRYILHSHLSTTHK